MQQSHEVRFVDLVSPIAQDGPKRRCAAGIVSDLTASVQKTELAHDDIRISTLPGTYPPFFRLSPTASAAGLVSHSVSPVQRSDLHHTKLRQAVP
jgi:hypothetical protein